jgi:hypothetical protein
MIRHLLPVRRTFGNRRQDKKGFWNFYFNRNREQTFAPKIKTTTPAVHPVKDHHGDRRDKKREAPGKGQSLA